MALEHNLLAINVVFCCFFYFVVSPYRSFKVRSHDPILPSDPIVLDPLDRMNI